MPTELNLLRIAVVTDDSECFDRVDKALGGIAHCRIVKPSTQPANLLKSAAKQRVNAFLIILGLRNESGLRWVRRLREAGPKIRIIACATVTDDGKNVIAAFESGADSYICLKNEVEDIVEGVTRTVAGSHVIAQEAIEPVVKFFRRGLALANQSTLSVAEARVVSLMSLGYDCKTVAAKLGVSVQTVYVHNRRIFRKLGVSNRVAAIVRFDELVNKSGDHNGNGWHNVERTETEEIVELTQNKRRRTIGG